MHDTLAVQLELVAGHAAGDLARAPYVLVLGACATAALEVAGTGRAWVVGDLHAAGCAVAGLDTLVEAVGVGQTDTDCIE